MQEAERDVSAHLVFSRGSEKKFLFQRLRSPVLGAGLFSDDVCEGTLTCFCRESDVLLFGVLSLVCLCIGGLGLSDSAPCAHLHVAS